MRIRHRDERGDTLMEIIIAIVVMGIVVSALFAAFTTAATASKRSRDFVTGDAALRNAAELVENTVRSSCTSGTTYAVPFSTNTNFLPPNLPAGFARPGDIPTTNCPPRTGAATAQVPVITLSVTLPNGVVKSLKVGVRSP
jgi:prepilin-type N-terminal cleavage/methylation domain-containing protein